MEPSTPVSLDPFVLFTDADMIGKAVMLSLVAASIASWAIIFAKGAVYARARRESRSFETAFASMEGLEGLHQRLGRQAQRGLPALFIAAMDEWTGSHAAAATEPSGLVARLRLVLDAAIAAEAARLERSLSLLATIGSAAPFVGLFGTVWGIMNAFAAIAQSKDTSLAVVAPGIAEALFATALGLFAAIPAVIAYNRLSVGAMHLVGRLENFADRLTVLLSRRLDAKAFS